MAENLVFGQQVTANFSDTILERAASPASATSPAGASTSPTRSTLYMPTLTAMRFEPAIKPFYERCVAGPSDKKPAVIAAMRKLLTILNARMRDHLASLELDPQNLLAA